MRRKPARIELLEETVSLGKRLRRGGSQRALGRQEFGLHYTERTCFRSSRTGRSIATQTRRTRLLRSPNAALVSNGLAL
jgi:hypothetical protein